MKVGILGAGSIAGTMAGTIGRMSEADNYAIASRDKAKAEAFAAKYGVERAYGSYEEFLADDEIDLVYIATPHSNHYEWTIKALEAGKNVLCEKAFAANAGQAKEMVAKAREKGLLLAEAIWTRYMPSRQIISDVIKSGELGEIRTVSANLCYKIDMNDRIVNPALAGGSLLDLTVYPLNFASMIFGNDIKRIAAAMVPTETGVDGQDSVMIEYNDGRMATMFTSIFGQGDRRGLVVGSKGYLRVENINNPQSIEVCVLDGSSHKVTREIAVPPQITGYEYEVLACRRAIEAGETECSEMPHSETIEIMEQMDNIRRQFGIVFPFE
ncbi:MAG: Gfo/Idh/MocA family oxidoreductase [Lachnospiraceae bacterium]|nr:Gfo/Idh/MocA family oxidoreductase [Lachnospiraceae bacterium]